MMVLIFELLGDFAYFKSPEGTRSSFSFPFPPKTAIVGLIAGIMGEERNKYWEKEEYRSLQVGIQIISHQKSMGIKMNYWRTKQIMKETEELKSWTPKLLLPSDVIGKNGRGYTTQVKHIYLLNVHYRIFITGQEHLLTDIAKRLKHKRYVYPPYLGHANLLAEVEFVAACKGEQVTAGKFVTVIPKTTLDMSHQISQLYDIGYFEVYHGVPYSYSVFKQSILGKDFYTSIPERYETVIVPEDELNAVVLPGHGIKVKVEEKEINVVVA